MAKQHDQQLVRVKTLMDSNDDDDMSSTSSMSDDNDSDRTAKITNLMRENERKIRNLSESYMNRFLMIGQQVQTTNALPRPTSATTTKSIMSRKSSDMQLDTMLSPPSLTLFIETLKQLIIKEEKKREKSYLPLDDDSSSDPYTRLSIGVTQCLRDYEAEINHAKRRINDLNEQQEHILNENKHVVSQLTEAFEQNTASLRQSYEKRLTKQREESLKIGQSLDTYKIEISNIRESYEKKLRVKDELINEVNERLVKSETEQAARQHALHLKIEHFQQSFETLQSRNKQLEHNNQIKAKENQDLLTQISNLQHQIQRLQQTITSKAHECTELSQKLSITLPKLTECERFGSELQQWFLLLSPEHSSSQLTLDDMSIIVSTKVAQFENFKKQFDIINDDLDTAHIFERNNLPERIRHLINHNKQVEIAQNDITNKYQALLLQTNMLTGIIKQHSTEVANHKTTEEQLKEFNEQLLNENQQIKLENQDYRSKLLQLTNKTNQFEHDIGLNKQHTRDLQIHFETIKAENQVLTNELQAKREAIKRYEQEVQMMKHSLEITLKEKQIQSDQLKHERQLFQSENDTLKQLVIRDGYEKQTITDLQRQYHKFQPEKETTENENRFMPITNYEENVIARRATSTPTPNENEIQQQSSIEPLGITKQINQVLNDMKCLLTHGRDVVNKHEQEIFPEKDFKIRDKSKSKRSKKERATIVGIEQH